MDQPPQQPKPKHLSPYIAPMHPRFGSIKMGRVHLGILFFALRFIDAILLFRGYPIMSMNNKEPFLGFIIAMAVLTTVLLFCVWFHQSWARYILICTILTIIVAGLAVFPCLKDMPNLSSATLEIFVLLVCYMGVALTLIFSKDIHRLTSRRFE